MGLIKTTCLGEERDCMGGREAEPSVLLTWRSVNSREGNLTVAVPFNENVVSAVYNIVGWVSVEKHTWG